MRTSSAPTQGESPGKLVLRERDERAIVHLTLNRPDTRNAFTGALIQELRTAFEELALASFPRRDLDADPVTIDCVRRGLGTAHLRSDQLGLAESRSRPGGAFDA